MAPTVTQTESGKGRISFNKGSRKGITQNVVSVYIVWISAEIPQNKIMKKESIREWL